MASLTDFLELKLLILPLTLLFSSCQVAETRLEPGPDLPAIRVKNLNHSHWERLTASSPPGSSITIHICDGNLQSVLSILAAYENWEFEIDRQIKERKVSGQYIDKSFRDIVLNLCEANGLRVELNRRGRRMRLVRF